MRLDLISTFLRILICGSPSFWSAYQNFRCLKSKFHLQFPKIRHRFQFIFIILIALLFIGKDVIKTSIILVNFY